MSANDTQVGGVHYKAEVQHWDLVCHHELGYLEGCATKYITRWKQKGGVADLEKARHYIVKAREMWNTRGNSAQPIDRDYTNQFFESNSVGLDERLLITGLLTWSEPEQLDLILQSLDNLISKAKTDADTKV